MTSARPLVGRLEQDDGERQRHHSEDGMGMDDLKWHGMPLHALSALFDYFMLV